MKEFKVVVPWMEGLHMRPAARLVKAANHFRSSIVLKCGEQITDLRSIISVVSLCATMGMTLDVTTSGEDEHAAAQAIQQIFSGPGANPADSTSKPGP
jgi:phosphotransferase system HPr (HPr) family protein